eukprot:Rhum_TRINITY_DN10513_c0_g1::Rhum_TRINITY_DN10513_c0_g1_i1::g.38801::m.38801
MAAALPQAVAEAATTFAAQIRTLDASAVGVTSALAFVVVAVAWWALSFRHRPDSAAAAAAASTAATGNVFCEDCSALGRYRSDDGLNSSFLTPAEAIPPLHTDAGGRSPPLSLQYSLCAGARKYECHKCGDCERTEAAIAAHCLACPHTLPDSYFPNRGWWPEFVMHRCDGTHVPTAEELVAGEEDGSSLAADAAPRHPPRLHIRNPVSRAKRKRR